MSATDPITPWEQRFELMQAEQRHLAAEGSWRSGPRDLLAVLGQSRRELAHCAALAWLLRPDGHHGLGSAFLESFLGRLGLTLQDATGAHVSTEVARANSRADIVIELAEGIVVVEAKVDAIEGPTQTHRLIADWDAAPNVTFVFLTLDGSAPAHPSFVTLTWSTVRADLEPLVATSRAASPPPRGWHAAETYLQALEAIS